MKNRYLAIIIIILLLIIILATILFVLQPIFITGKAIITEYSFTKAICNSSNFCQDYTIICKGNETVSINPITGSAVQMPESWQDARTKEQIEKSCE